MRRPHYIWREALLKTLFCPECQCCRTRRAAFRGYLCIPCIRSILKDFSLAKGNEEVLLYGSTVSRRLVGILRESRHIWSQLIFQKFYRRKFPALRQVDWITAVPQQKRKGPSGLVLFCENLSRETKVPYIRDALRKNSRRTQHGLAARERLDREAFIAGTQEVKTPAGTVLLLDDVETTGTSILQAERALRSGEPDKRIRRLTLVKAWNCQKNHAEHECGEV